MSLEMFGKNILIVEIIYIFSYGIWLLFGDNELFLFYDDFFWFKNVLVKYIFNVIELIVNYFYWFDLDVDLILDIIKYFECFFLVCIEF